LTPKLKDIEVSKDESSRLQRIADIADDKFEEILEEAEVQSKKITSNMLVNIAREAQRVERKAELKNNPPKIPEGVFNVIYADPPWKYNDKQDIEKLGGATKHYSTMSIEELCDLPIEEMLTDNCVLFLWVTSPLLEECFSIIKSWGFKYKTSFIWDKVKHNMGHYNSVRHELLLVCTRGSMTPEVPKLFDSVVTEERSDKHSEKPEVFYEIIETLYPNGKYLELFSRKSRDKWTSFGNQIS